MLTYVHLRIANVYRIASNNQKFSSARSPYSREQSQVQNIQSGRNFKFTIKNLNYLELKFDCALYGGENSTIFITKQKNQTNNQVNFERIDIFRSCCNIELVSPLHCIYSQLWPVFIAVTRLLPINFLVREFLSSHNIRRVVCSVSQNFITKLQKKDKNKKIGHIRKTRVALRLR
jgi:hypothetical protein